MSGEKIQSHDDENYIGDNQIKTGEVPYQREMSGEDLEIILKILPRLSESVWIRVLPY